MKRWQALAILAASMTFGAVACTTSPSGNNPPGTETKGAGSSSDTWVTMTDPENGRTFRCYYLYRDNGYDGGPALWCYEPNPL